MRTKITVDIRKCDNCGKTRAIVNKKMVYNTFNGWIYSRNTNGIGIRVDLDFCCRSCNVEYHKREDE